MAGGSFGNSYTSWSQLRTLQLTSTTDEDDHHSEATASTSFATNKIDGDVRIINESGQLEQMFLPDEVLEQILSYCDVKDVLRINQTCCRWKTMTCSVPFWRAVFKRRNIEFGLIPQDVLERENCWIGLYAIAKENLLNRNFIKNSCGASRFLHWNLTENGGDGVIVENPPVGCDALPASAFFKETSCFVTSFRDGTLSQTIKLADFGLTENVLSLLTPIKLCFSVMAGTRFDCRAKGRVKMEATNLNGYARSIGMEAKFTSAAGSNWKEIKLELILEEGDLAHEVKITLSGSDGQFWAGHYGIKFARSSLRIKLSKEVEISHGPEGHGYTVEIAPAYGSLR